MYIIMFEGVRPGKEESEHGLSHLKHREITFDKIKNILKIKTSLKFDSQLKISLKIKEEKYQECLERVFNKTKNSNQNVSVFTYQELQS